VALALEKEQRATEAMDETRRSVREEEVERADPARSELFGRHREHARGLLARGRARADAREAGGVEACEEEREQHLAVRVALDLREAFR